MLVHRGRWRRYPVGSDGQAASRREQWTRWSECLAGAGYLEMLRHCVTTTGAQFACEPRRCCRTTVAAAGSVGLICTPWLPWIVIVCRLSCGWGSDACASVVDVPRDVRRDPAFVDR